MKIQLQEPAQLNYRFQDQSLWRLAMTHGSKSRDNYERLEFLGDAILGMIMSEYLYHRYPNQDEGFLTRCRSSLVNRKSLASIAQTLDLSPCLQLGNSEMRSGGQHKSSILACAVEAIIGAIYLDAGYDVCKQLVLGWFEHRLLALTDAGESKDPKTLLQEHLQAKHLPLPIYTIDHISGQAHDQTFWVTCEVQGVPSTRGQGRSRREAERVAAQSLMQAMIQP